MSESTHPIIMIRRFWENSPLSIVRMTGRIKAYGHEYWVVDRYGRSIFSTSIAEGEPADLVRHDFITLYAALGREDFIRIVSMGVGCDKDLKARMKAEAERLRKKRKEKKASPVEGSLF